MDNLGTHVEPPSHFVRPGVGPHVALEVDVVALLDVGAVQAAPQAQDRLRGVCKNHKKHKDDYKMGRKIHFISRLYVRDYVHANPVPSSQRPQISPHLSPPHSFSPFSLSLSLLGAPFSGDVNALLQREIAHVIKSLWAEDFSRKVV